jgi:BirA family transcriptional regulator, biotin operon repressor / biotin---[acetyl-CoA-carboxylase] ligase
MSPAPLSPLTFRTLRLLADGEFHSGEALARALRVSRTTVWKALQGVEEWGVTLFKVHGRGYQMVTPVDWLDVQQISRHLGVHQEELQMHVVDVVDSTNSLLLAEAQAGAPGGLAVAAELQTRGRGRRGRGWQTGLGDALTFSLLWRFRQGVGALHGLSLAVGVALVRAVRALGANEAMVKWPNDVLWRQHKLAGVLIEVQGGAAGPSAAVIGVGINVRLNESIRDRIDQPVADLAGAGVPPQRNRILARVLGELADVLGVFAAGGFAALKPEWEGYHLLSGQPVWVTLSEDEAIGAVVAGVDDDGSLLAQTATGLRRFQSGDVSLRLAEDMLPARQLRSG